MTDKIILVCARVDGPLLLPDNRVGKCAECGRLVEYRPHAPKNRILRCMQCAVPLMRDDDELITTARMIADAKAYRRRKQH